MAPGWRHRCFWMIADLVGARLARDSVRPGAAFFGRGAYPFLRSRLLAVSPLRRLTFFRRQKSMQKRLPLRTAFAALRFPRSGVHQGASTPVGFASTSIRCPRLRRGALRAIPLMNTSARPPDGAGGSRAESKAKAKAKAKAGAGAKAILRFDGGRMADVKPCSRCPSLRGCDRPRSGRRVLRPLEDLRSYRSLRQRLQRSRLYRSLL
ncbi:hypothetical protein C4K04_0896 [Pseudomonas chlororaphis]|uniref:Uncharacterized protein n=1 Tax=Pseudomonas chlororaphis TaxID=587753 RepID=A0A3G7TIX1_9PSED|nr:hypothetical protein C4K04_0896 [Pseudomonas chlororaphis]